MDTASRWDLHYSLLGPDDYPAVAVLAEHRFLLPENGTALDLACGLGANAVFLAQQHLAVTAWDISTVAINKLNAYSRHRGLNVSACQQNISPDSFAGLGFDVIVVSRFLDRGLSDAIIDALKPDGLLFYQTFTQEKATPSPPNNPDYLLTENELLTLFSPLRVVFYQENALLGNKQQGLRNEAQFIGQKRHQWFTQ
ncbi:MAG: methyltransferase domain-containing protein [Methylococcales bacterium]|nr:methyltransferase domain-containing protein [Methylococcales bacterium]